MAGCRVRGDPIRSRIEMAPGEFRIWDLGFSFYIEFAKKLFWNDIMTRQQVLDLYFMDARSKLIDLAAFIDRVQRGNGNADFRLEAFQRALGELSKQEGNRAEAVLLAFSDPTTDPIEKATTKAACGAWPGGR